MSRGLLAFVLAACFLAACSIAYQVVQGYLSGPKIAATARPKRSSWAPAGPRPRWVLDYPITPFDDGTGDTRRSKRLCLFIVDGLPEAVAFTPGRLPWFDSLRARGAWGVSRAPAVTMTTSCVRTIGTGYAPPLMDVLRTFDAPAVREDNLFARLGDGRYRTTFAGDASWTQLFGAWADSALALPDRGIYDTTESDQKAEEFLLKRREELQPLVPHGHVWVAHFVGSDHVAHRTAASGEEYYAKLREIDARMERIYHAQQPLETDFVVVMADHGATAAGNHGGGEEVARRAPFVIAGPGIRPGGPYETDHRAWAATLACLLGVEAPDRAERGPAWEFVIAGPETRARRNEEVDRKQRAVLGRMGVSPEALGRAASCEEMDALREEASGAQPGEVAYAGIAAMALLSLLVAVACAPSGLARPACWSGTAGGTWMIFGATVLAGAVVLWTGEWRPGLLLGLVATSGFAFRLHDERRSWPVRVGPPWILGVAACYVATWAYCDGWRAARAGDLVRVAGPALAVLVMGVPVARSPGRIARLVKEGGLGLSLFAVAAAVPAVWCYWWSHRAIYAAIAVLPLGAIAWSRGPRSLRPFLPLAAMLAWALTAPDAERVPREVNSLQTVLLGAVLCLPVLLGLRRLAEPACWSVWPLVLSAGFLGLGFVYRLAGVEALVDVMLLGGLPVAIGASLLARDSSARRRVLLLWGLGLFRVLAKDHQFVTLALYAWLLDELAERFVVRTAHLAVLVGAMVALDLLQFHLLGSVYTFSTIDVTTGFVGTSIGLDLPRTAALIFLRYAVPLLFLALLPPPQVRARALALFAACLLSRCVYLLVLFPWNRSNFWWVCSAAPGVIFTAFQIGLWLLVALAAVSTVSRPTAAAGRVEV